MILSVCSPKDCQEIKQIKRKIIMRKWISVKCYKTIKGVTQRYECTVTHTHMHTE